MHTRLDSKSHGDDVKSLVDSWLIGVVCRSLEMPLQEGSEPFPPKRRWIEMGLDCNWNPPLFLGNTEKWFLPHQNGWLDQSYRQDRVVLVQGGDAVECGQAGATGAWVLQDGRCEWNFHDSMCWMNIRLSPKWNFPNSPPKSIYDVYDFLGVVRWKLLKSCDEFGWSSDVFECIPSQ